MVERVERYTRKDGKIAVLISPGYGAGWSTWAPEKDVEALLFDAKIVKAVLAGLHETAASLAIMRTYQPRQNQSDSSDPESNESDSEMAMSTIINNGLDITSAGADSKGGDPAGMVDAEAKGLDTKPIDCSNSVARSESAKPAEDDASKNAAVSKTTTRATITSGNANDNEINYLGSYERHAQNHVFYGSARTLIIEWLDPGEEFQVKEYDGDESILRKRNWTWHVA